MSKSLHTDLAEVMAEVGYVQKDGKNEHFKYKYASAEAVLRKVNTAISSRGVCVASRARVEWLSETGGNAVVHLALTFSRGAGDGYRRGPRAGFG